MAAPNTNYNDIWSQFFGNYDANNSDRDYSNVDSDNDECYDLLGVHKSASSQQISKAYRSKLIPISNHPANSDQVEYINTAFKILSDDKTRKLYDEGGLLKIKKTNYSQSARDFNRDYKLPSMVYAYRRITVPVTLEEAYNGVAAKKIKLYDRKLEQDDFIVKNDLVVCYGYVHQTVPALYVPHDIILHIFKQIHYVTRSCGACGGTGKGPVSTRTIGAMRMQQTTKCKFCEGTGHQDGVVRTIAVTENVDITKGVDKYKVRYENQIFTISLQLEKHAVYQVNDLHRQENLSTECEIDLKQAFLGFNCNVIQFRHLNGRMLTVNTMRDDIVIQNGSFVVLKGYGMPVMRSRKDEQKEEQERYGDLRIIFRVNLPKTKQAAMQFMNTFEMNEKEECEPDNVVIADYYECEKDAYGLLHGRRAKIVGLTKSTHLNDKLVELVSYHHETERWTVKLLDHNEKAKHVRVKIDNLQFVNDRVDANDGGCKQM